MTWQREYIAWHIATEHPWDVALYMEAITLNVDAFRHALGEALTPVLRSIAEALG